MKDTRIMLLTRRGILDQDGSAIEGTPFDHRPIIAGTMMHGSPVVIVDSHEIWAMTGDTWSKIAETDLILNCVSCTLAGTIIVGTAEARVARIDSGSLTFFESFDAIPERTQWSTPWGGPPDVRSLAVSDDGVIYANIHVGWIAKSDDEGATWKCLKNGLEKDVHQVAVHANYPNTVIAATARGFHLSDDYGESFHRVSEPMPYYYQRACASFPATNIFLCTTSKGPHGQADALLFRSEDRGATWQSVSDLPPDIAANLDTFQLAADASGRAWLVVENHNLWKSDDYGKSWSFQFNTTHRIDALLCL